jgi:hypothetical protein
VGGAKKPLEIGYILTNRQVLRGSETADAQVIDQVVIQDAAAMPDPFFLGAGPAVGTVLQVVIAQINLVRCRPGLPGRRRDLVHPGISGPAFPVTADQGQNFH